MAQIDAVVEMNKVLEAQKKSLEDISKLMKGQLALRIQTEAVISGAGNVDKTAAAYKNLSDLMGVAADAAENNDKKTRNLDGTIVRLRQKLTGTNDAIEKSTKKFDALAVAAAGVDGAMKGFSASMAGLSGIGGIIGTIGGAIFDLAKTVIAFPFEVWNTLFEKAAALPTSTAWRTALEKIRGEFGALGTGSSKAMIDMTKSMRGHLDETGLRVRRIFGNRAEVLGWINGVAKSMGNMFQVLRDNGQLANKDVERFGAMYKGLGMTEDGMKAVARESLLSGKTIVESMTEIGNYALQMGKAYGINAKEISKDVIQMGTDLKHFGGMSKKALFEASIYARKLGTDIKDLTGLMDTFDSLDSAMEATAKLNQSLGLNLQGLDLLNASAKGGPAEVADAVRKSMKEQGFSIAGLTRLQKNMMASTLGLTNETLELMDAQNKGASLDDIKKKGDAAKKSQLSQVEVTKKLADSIERLVQEMQPLKAGLFAAFFDGFQKGVFNSYEFRKILREINQVLRIVTRSGRELGWEFMKTFPGVKEMADGLGDLFNPARWKAMMRQVIDVFKTFFVDMQTNPEAGLKTLTDKLKKIFFDQFDNSQSGGKKIIEGFKKFFSSVVKAIVAALKMIIPVVMNALTELLKGILGFFRDKAPSPIGDALGEMMAQFVAILSELWGMIKQSWPALKSVLMELLDFLKATLYKWADDNPWVVKGFFIYLFGPALISSVFNTIGALVTQIGIKAIGSALAKVAADKGVTTAARAVISGGTSASGAATAATEAGAAAVTSVSPGVQAAGAAAPRGLPPLNASMLMWAAFIAIGIVAIVGAIIGLAHLIEGGPLEKPEVLISTLAVIGGATTIMGAIAFMAYAIVAAGPAAAEAVPLLLPFGLFILGMSGILAGLTLMIVGIAAISGNISSGKIQEVAVAVGLMTLVLMAMGPLALEAIAFAAILSESFGTAAIAVETGMAAMAAMALQVVEITRRIINAARTLDTSESTKAKIDLVMQVMGVLSGFAGSVASLLKTMPPVPEGDINGFKRNMDQIINFIKSVKEQLISFVLTVKAIAGGLADDIGTKTKIITDIISALIGVVTSVANVFQTAENNKSWHQSGAEAYNNTIHTLENFFSNTKGSVMNGIQHVIENLGNYLSKLGSVNAPAVKAFADALVPILKAITGMVVGLGTVAISALKNDIDYDTIGMVIQEILNALFGYGGTDEGIIPAIKTIIKALTDAAIGIPNDAVIKIGVVGYLMNSVLGNIANMMRGMAEATKNIKGLKADVGIAAVIKQMSDTVTTITRRLSLDIPNLIGMLNRAFAGVTDIEAFKAKILILVELLKFLGDVGSTFKSLGDTFASFGGRNKNISLGLTSIRNMLVGDGTAGNITVFSIIKRVMGAILEINPADVVKIANLPSLRIISGKLDEITAITGSIASIITAMKAIRDVGLTIDANLFQPIKDTLYQLTGQDVLGKSMGEYLQDAGKELSKFNLSTVSTGLYKVAMAFVNISKVNIAAKQANDRISATGDDAMTKLRTFLGGDEKHGILGMILAVNEIGTAMDAMNIINYEAKLKSIGNFLGLTGEVLEIKNKNFNIYIAVDVTMDAGDIESVFRDRANDAVGDGTSGKFRGRFMKTAFREDGSYFDPN